MRLTTRNVVAATVSLGVLAVALIAWQVAKQSPASDGTTTASGVVTRAPLREAAPTAVAASTPDSPAVSTAASEPSPPASPPASPPTATPAQAAPRPPVASGAVAAPSAPAIKHSVSARATQPPILPNEVDRVVAQTLGPKTMARYFYLEPLARRFVASVDQLGERTPATSQWLLKPARGELLLAKNRRAQNGQPIAAANSQRYADFLRWFERTDNARLLSLYARMYPLLQQTYVELGHPQGYFNDRLIAVMDQMLATPVQKSALRVKPASPETLAAAAQTSTPTTPRYEFADPALEALSTGQKMMLRIGPAQAARLKIKLKSLRAGLLRLGR